MMILRKRVCFRLPRIHFTTRIRDDERRNDEMMTAQTRHSLEAYELLLKISRSANSHLELPTVLKSAAECLGRNVYLDGIAVTSVHGDHVCPHWLYSAKTDISPGDSFHTVASRVLDVPLTQIDRRVPRSLPFSGSAAEQMLRSGSPLIRVNLERERQFPRKNSCSRTECAR